MFVCIVYGKTFLHWAQELGAAGLKIASAAQAASFRNTPAAAKAMSGNIVDLVVAKRSHLSLYRTHERLFIIVFVGRSPRHAEEPPGAGPEQR